MLRHPHEYCGPPPGPCSAVAARLRCLEALGEAWPTAAVTADAHPAPPMMLTPHGVLGAAEQIVSFESALPALGEAMGRGR
ncbi:hypothetical protein NDU88_001876 [Pleurodeles waltl]|uniref:Uncharacterized protein n=1 Tax=Pleurodeles waltl TaxID=8319 RepID=A0AAV7WMV3_PLEWA|nr:hypothetical protein NDU88_001876 [Pleurodeles waltl]